MRAVLVLIVLTVAMAATADDRNDHLPKGDDTQQIVDAIDRQTTANDLRGMPSRVWDIVTICKKKRDRGIELSDDCKWYLAKYMGADRE